MIKSPFFMPSDHRIPCYPVTGTDFCIPVSKQAEAAGLSYILESDMCKYGTGRPITQCPTVSSTNATKKYKIMRKSFQDLAKRETDFNEFRSTGRRVPVKRQLQYWIHETQPKYSDATAKIFTAIAVLMLFLALPGFTSPVTETVATCALISFFATLLAFGAALSTRLPSREYRLIFAMIVLLIGLIVIVSIPMSTWADIFAPIFTVSALMLGTMVIYYFIGDRYA